MRSLRGLRLAAALAVAAGVFVVAPETVSAACSGSAHFYGGPSFTGSSITANYGTNWSTMPGGWDNTISSMTWNISESCGLKVYSSPGFGGSSLTLCGSGSYATMPAGWDNNISSIKWFGTGALC